jgi:hypothetical protein
VDELILVNALCEGDPDLRSYADFLRRKLGDRATVTLIEMADCADFSAIPPELFQRVAGQEIKGIPVVVLNDKILMSGQLPNWMDSFEIIEKAMADSARAS